MRSQKEAIPRVGGGCELISAGLSLSIGRPRQPSSRDWPTYVINNQPVPRSPPPQRPPPLLLLVIKVDAVHQQGAPPRIGEQASDF